jgi:putative oxidoreductase
MSQAFLRKENARRDLASSLLKETFRRTTILDSFSHSREGKEMMFTPSSHGKEPSDYLTVPLRLALGLSFLFPVADRLGILGPPGTTGVDWGNFANFLRYNAQVNSFAPAAIRPILGVTATVLESLFGITLFLGVCTPLVAVGAGGLLLLLGTAMAISFGIKSPFDYSVFSAMGGALLLAAWGVYPLSADSLFQQVMRHRQAGGSLSCDRDARRKEDTV